MTNSHHERHARSMYVEDEQQILQMQETFMKMNMKKQMKFENQNTKEPDPPPAETIKRVNIGNVVWTDFEEPEPLKLVRSTDAGLSKFWQPTFPDVITVNETAHACKDEKSKAGKVARFDTFGNIVKFSTISPKYDVECKSLDDLMYIIASSVRSQRLHGLRVIRNIIKNEKTGNFENRLNKSVTSALVQSGLLVRLRMLLDNGDDVAMVSLILECLIAIVTNRNSNSATHALLEWYKLWINPDLPMYSVACSDIYIHDSKVCDKLTDLELSIIDPTLSLAQMNIIERCATLLHQTRILEIQILVLELIRVLSTHSYTVLVKVVSCQPLCDEICEGAKCEMGLKSLPDFDKTFISTIMLILLYCDATVTDLDATGSGLSILRECAIIAISDSNLRQSIILSSAEMISKETSHLDETTIECACALIRLAQTETTNPGIHSLLQLTLNRLTDSIIRTDLDFQTLRQLVSSSDCPGSADTDAFYEQLKMIIAFIHVMTILNSSPCKMEKRSSLIRMTQLKNVLSELKDSFVETRNPVAGGPLCAVIGTLAVNLMVFLDALSPRLSHNIICRLHSSQLELLKVLLPACVCEVSGHVKENNQGRTLLGRKYSETQVEASVTIARFELFTDHTVTKSMGHGPSFHLSVQCPRHYLVTLDWVYSACRLILRLQHSMRQDQLVEYNKSILAFIYHVECDPNLDYTRWTPSSVKFLLVSSIFLQGSNCFLDETVYELLMAVLMKLAHNWTVDFEPTQLNPYTGTFIQFYRDFVESYDQESFNDNLFAIYVLMPIAFCTDPFAILDVLGSRLVEVIPSVTVTDVLKFIPASRFDRFLVKQSISSKIALKFYRLAIRLRRNMQFKHRVQKMESRQDNSAPSLNERELTLFEVIACHMANSFLYDQSPEALKGSNDERLSFAEYLVNSPTDTEFNHIIIFFRSFAVPCPGDRVPFKYLSSSIYDKLPARRLKSLQSHLSSDAIKLLNILQET